MLALLLTLDCFYLHELYCWYYRTKYQTPLSIENEISRRKSDENDNIILYYKLINKNDCENRTKKNEIRMKNG